MFFFANQLTFAKKNFFFLIFANFSVSIFKICKIKKKNLLRGVKSQLIQHTFSFTHFSYNSLIIYRVLDLGKSIAYQKK